MAKSRSAKGAFHQPVFMGNCLTIRHTCLASERVSACVPGVIEGSEDAGSAVKVSCGWFAGAWNLYPQTGVIGKWLSLHQTVG